MSTTTIESASTAVFELIRYVDGRAVPYVPYQSDCGACCSSAAAVAPTRSCCHG